MKKLLLLFAALCSTIMLQAEIVHHNQCAPGRQRGFTQECWEDTESKIIYSDATCTKELNAAKVVHYSKLATNNLSLDDREGQIADGEYGGATFYYPYKKTVRIDGDRYEICSFKVNGLSSNNARLKLYVTGESETIESQTLCVQYSFDTFDTEYYHLHPGLMSIPLPTMNFGDIVYLTIDTRMASPRIQEIDIIASLEYEADSQVIITAENKQKFIGTEDQMLTWSQAGDLIYGEKLNISIEREQGEDIGAYSIHASKSGTGNPDVDVTFVDGTFTIVDGTHHPQLNPTINHIGYKQDLWEEKSTGKFYSDDYLEHEINQITTILYPKLLLNPIVEATGFAICESETYEGNNFNWVAKVEYQTGETYDSYSVFDVRGADITDARLVWYTNSNSSYTHGEDIDVFVNGKLFHTEHNISSGLYVIPLPELRHGDQVKFAVMSYSRTTYPVFFGASLEYLSPFGGDPDAWSIVADNKRKFSGVDDPELSWTRRFVNTPSEEPEGIIITRESGETPGIYNIHVTQEPGANSGRNVFFIDGTLEIVEGTHHKKGEACDDDFIYLQDCWENTEDDKYYLDGYLEHELERKTVIGYPKLAVNPIMDRGKFIIKESAVYDDTPFDWVAETTFEERYTNDKRSVEFKVCDEDVTNARLALYINTDPGPTAGLRHLTVYRNDEEIFSDRMKANEKRSAGLMFVPLPDLNRGDIIRFEFDWEGHNATPTVAVCMQYCSPTATVAGTIDIAMDDKHNYYDIRTDVNTKLTWFNNTDDRLLQTDVPGTIGSHYGREAIVVDLGGSVGKVAVATKNEGTVNNKMDYDRDLGTLFTYEDANDYSKNNLKDGWYVPSYEELGLLVDKLDYYRNITQYSYIVSLKWEIGYGATLWMPGLGGLNDGGSYIGSETNNGYYAGFDFIMNVDGNANPKGWYKEVYENYEPKEEGYLRPFHRLNENHRCVKIETDNEVLNVFDAYSDTKISFIPKASERETSLKLVYNGNAPIETEHLVAGTVFSHSEDGSLITMTVNGNCVEYAFDDVKEITFFDGTPSVQLHTNEDPDHAGNYYTTFYSGLEAYTLPEGVKAYTATMDKGNGETAVRLTAIEGDVLPKGEAVLLHSTTTSNIQLFATSEDSNRLEENLFEGVDVESEQIGTNYMLFYGQDGLGFYRMNEDAKLSPNKAYIPNSSTGYAKAFRMVFANSEAVGIEDVNVNINDTKNSVIYNLNGMRLSKLQKGINIVDGKKIIVK